MQEHTIEREVKLARTAMRSYVARLHKEQGGLCPLCRKPIDLAEKGEGVLDHDHVSGRIRGVLHRSCNAVEGKVKNAVARWGGTGEDYSKVIPYLENLVAYLKTPARPVIYPLHKTKDERLDAQRAKARERAAEVRAKRKLAEAKRKEAA